ncbi:MAG: hypothetical protein ACC631_02360, partial [Halocynthiibacter sp.]
MAEKMDPAAELEALFDIARRSAAEPSKELLAQVYETAVITQNQPEPSATRVRRKNRVLAALSGAVGGWPAVAGMASAVLVGVWIGISPPDGLQNIRNAVFTSEADLYLARTLPGIED